MKKSIRGVVLYGLLSLTGLAVAGTVAKEYLELPIVYMEDGDGIGRGQCVAVEEKGGTLRECLANELEGRYHEKLVPVGTTITTILANRT